ncbi:VOC family protein [Candidatus Peregrinibacteria bacterium]|nr:VOC family protein [Candidatus Peregrinibacteria bacterium]
MQTITPFLWFNDNTEEAVAFYASTFTNATIGSTTRYSAEAARVSGRPEGSVMTVAFRLCGQEFAALNGGPVFTFTPAISFFVTCETMEEIDALWTKLADGGNVLMEFGKYPFSEKYGWLNDKYGVSWQLFLGKTKQEIAPAFLFVGERYGKAEEAIHFYISLFEDSSLTAIHRNGPGTNEKEGTVQYASFLLNKREWRAMEGNTGHQFTFTPATSFVVHCDTQEEIDRYWKKLSADKAAEQCGWLKDTYGVSWQIVPTMLAKMLHDKDPEKSRRVMRAILRMKKIDIQSLEKAFALG